MTLNVTIDLDAETTRLAEEEAARHHTTIAEVLKERVEVMAKEGAEHSAMAAAVERLRGCITLPPDFDLKEVVAEEIWKKHGAR